MLGVGPIFASPGSHNSAIAFVGITRSKGGSGSGTGSDYNKLSDAAGSLYALSRAISRGTANII